MKRIYTDERFPGVEIENDGGTLFRVRFPLDSMEATFHAQENLKSQQVSEAFARKRAEDFFEHMASMNLSAELDAENWGAPPTEPTPLRKVTPDEVERAMAAARAEQDPARKRALEQRALRLMGREESLPEQVVGHLLYEA